MKVTQDKERQKQCTVETIAWLHQAWALMQAGQPLQADPWYPRTALLTPEVVKDVLGGIETLFATEFKKFPTYHLNAQKPPDGAKLVPPKFLSLPYTQQLALVQGIDRIFQAYRDETPEQPAEPAADEHGSDYYV